MNSEQKSYLSDKLDDLIKHSGQSDIRSLLLECDLTTLSALIKFKPEFKALIEDPDFLDDLSRLHNLPPVDFDHLVLYSSKLPSELFEHAVYQGDIGLARFVIENNPYEGWDLDDLERCSWD